MASNSAVLNMHFLDAGDEPVLIKFTNAKKTATASDIKDLADEIITNGAMWDQVPVTKVSAELVETNVTEITITD